MIIKNLILNPVELTSTYIKIKKTSPLLTTCPHIHKVYQDNNDGIRPFGGEGGASRLAKLLSGPPRRNVFLSLSFQVGHHWFQKGF